MNSLHRIMAFSVILACLSFCGKKQPAEPDARKTTFADADRYGIRRRIWGEDVTAQDRVDAASAVKGLDLDLTGEEEAIVETKKGEFIIQLFSNDVPRTVENFIKLSQVGFYDGTIIYQYDPEFVIRAGDPTATGMGNPGYFIDFEEGSKKHQTGSVAMARIGEDMNSASCLFYICLTPQPNLDGSYCVFGKVTDGMEIVYYLRAKDTIQKITVTEE
ncbi:peptidylprolyl isomerase [candidate division WOR-3 bacterium]|uniref:Peptidyl-prolyl cis-trans isomerase n=1 Tax=candidate division WOR-3 bacterium TaxID=2052148 RepID=A0A9D5K9X3_UNCW3|nr:peptidylprolyl isomerase [candidate division WOR-3 bacterium]MBD3365137.1 peptidylprolyl isomerase [candidate division WOR-3 bacterium]